MVREGQKRKNRGSSPKIDESPQLAVLNNLNGSSPYCGRLIFVLMIFSLKLKARNADFLGYSATCDINTVQINHLAFL